jgi:hypothetical protein
MKCPNDRIDPSYKQHNPAFIKGGRRWPKASRRSAAAAQ